MHFSPGTSIGYYLAQELQLTVLSPVPTKISSKEVKHFDTFR